MLKFNLSRQLFLASTCSEYERYLNQIKQPERTLNETFHGVIQELSHSKYGQSYGIKMQSSYKEFSKQIPVITYDDISSHIKKSAKGKSCYLTSSKIKGYESTSGSSGSVKIIPYTQAGLEQFQKYFSIYIHDTLKHRPDLRSLKTFYSISPPPIQGIKDMGDLTAFRDDEDYLSFFGRILARKYGVMPQSIREVDRFKEFRIRLAIHLLNAIDLEIFFIWSPTYLISLKEFIEHNRNEISEYLDKWKPHMGKLRNRAHVQNTLNKVEFNATTIWPNLKLISCWTEAGSRGFAHQLETIFSGIEIQPKGLLSTEAAISIRLHDTPYSIPLIGLNYLEFLMEDGTFCPMLELSQNENYEIVISNRSGLYRYRTHDLVRVHGYWKRLPLLEFIGRNNLLSDLVGEKITEAEVTTFFQKLWRSNSTWLLVPDEIYRGYRILTNDMNLDLNPLQELEKYLLLNYHYRYAREIGQLKQIKLNRIPDLVQLYEEICIEKGIKWGDIKIPQLISNIDFAKSILIRVNLK